MLARALLLCALTPVALAQSTGSAAPPPAAAFATSAPVTFSGLCDQALFVCTPNGNIFQVDNYDTNPVASLFVSTGVGALSDIAVDPVSGDIFMNVFGTGDLFRSDFAGNVSLVGNPNFALGSVNALDFTAQGVLYARGGTALWAVDVNAVQSTLIGTTTSASSGDVAVGAAGQIYGTTLSGEINLMDPFTAEESIIGSTQLVLYGLEIDCDGRMFAITPGGDLYEIDPLTGQPTLIGNININEDCWGIAFYSPVDGTVTGNNYCGAVANSTGFPGSMSALGSLVATDNTLQLLATNLPEGQFAYFLASQSQAFIPNAGGSQGNLCLALPIARFTPGLGQVFAGQFGLQLDTTNVPLPPTNTYTITAGETWNFQCWYRDQNPTPTSNFTDALELQFQ